MNKKIIITGKLIKCKKGIYSITGLKEEASKIFNELIDLIKDFCGKPDSRYIQIEIDEKGATSLFTPRDCTSKDFDGGEKSVRVLEKYNQALLEIEKLD